MAIEIAFNDNAPLPLPNENIGISLVGHVIGSFVAMKMPTILSSGEGSQAHNGNTLNLPRD